nr:leucine-rich repeat domain-containing protein [Lachnospiraceae bacterium]
VMPPLNVKADEVVEINEGIEESLDKAIDEESGSEASDENVSKKREDEAVYDGKEVLDKKTGLKYWVLNRDKTAKVIGYEEPKEGYLGGFDVVIPEVYDGYTVIGIDKHAFDVEWSDCVSINSISLPSTLEYIDRSAFYAQRNLKNVTFRDIERSRLTVISENAFMGAAALSEIELPDSVTIIGSGAFRGYKVVGTLKSIRLPKHLRVIEGSAFEYQTSLTNVEFNHELEKMGWGAFACTGLTDVRVPNCVTDMRLSFQNNDGIESFVYPNKTTQLLQEFTGCRNLKRIYIPKTVEEVYFSSFDAHDVPSLTDVYYQGSEEEFNKIKIGKENEMFDKAAKHFNASLADFGVEDDPDDPYGDPTPVTPPSPSPTPDTPSGDKPAPTPGTPSSDNPDQPAPVTPSSNTPSGNTPSGNTPVNDPTRTTIARDGFIISYNSVVAFSGGKLNASSFGAIDIKYDGKQYTASKVKINKKNKKLQITNISPADKAVKKAIKKLTKGSGGLDYSVKAYTVSQDTSVMTKFSKSGELKSVKITFGEHAYKCKKDEYDFDPNAKTITFKGDNLAGKYIIK